MAILCAVDFSEGSRDAADAAGALARRWGVPLWLLHVVDERFERGFGEGLEGLVRTSLDAEVQRLGAGGRRGPAAAREGAARSASSPAWCARSRPGSSSSGRPTPSRRGAAASSGW